MARTIDYWYQQIIAQKNADENLAGLNSTSRVSLYNLWAYIIAVCQAALDNLFDLHKNDVATILATQKPHRQKWYRELALRFQYGQQLTQDTDSYANIGLTAQQIASQLIISQAAVTELDGKLRIKIVKLVDSDYASLTADELSAFKAYIAATKDAGVKIICDSLDPDSLKLNIDIYYDPLVMRGDGGYIDGSAATPVGTAIKTYLKNLEFNGEYADNRLITYLNSVTGVQLVNIRVSQARYGAFPFTAINERYIPDAGYLRIAPGDLILNYIPYVQY